ncbi:hypothetical protein EUTSA_v10000643mg, partial [Eutrema salsugineum]
MKKKENKGDNDNRDSLPLDVMVEVFSKLHVKSLFKFRCVSKQWCSIICSRSFIDSFMSLSLSRPRILLCLSILRGDKMRLLFLSSPLHPQDSNHSSIVYKHDMPDSRISRSNILGLTSCVFIRLPNDPLTGLDPKLYIYFMCLGYDTSNNQYKVLRTVRRTPFGSVEHSVSLTNVSNPPTRFVIVSFDVGSREKTLVRLIDNQGKLACFCVTNDKSYSLWILDDVKKQLWSKASFFRLIF